MLYQSQTLLRDSTSSADLPVINRQLDKVILPAAEWVQRVRSAGAYNSFHGGIAAILGIEGLATIDRLKGDREMGQRVASLDRWVTRDGPADAMFERGAWQSAYARQ